MDILIIEDEPIAAEKIKDILGEIVPDGRIAPVLDTIDESIVYLKTHTPDIIFLDIELADGSSFEIFESVQIKSPIIFTTAYNQYAIQAFEVNSVDYLLKPITKESIISALANLQKMKDTFSYQLLKQSLQDLQVKADNKKYKSSFLVKSGESLIPINERQIAYFFASNKWVYLVTNEGKENLINYTLNEIEGLLNPEHFFRVARNYMVRRESIVKLTPYFKGQVTVDISPKNKELIVVSRARTGNLKQWLSDGL